MAAVNGACTLAPLSAIIILFELTNEYEIILPLIFTVVMATFVSRKLSPESIYTEKLRRRGIHVQHGEDLNSLRAISVQDVLRHDEASICEMVPFDSLVRPPVAMFFSHSTKTTSLRAPSPCRTLNTFSTIHKNSRISIT